MKHQLIIFYGSSPGSGKSSLSSFLFAQLKSSGVAVEWMYEEDIVHMEVFSQAVRDVQHRKPEMIDSLLAASECFVEQCAASGHIYITDSTFPYFDWLFAANYSPQVLWKFSQDLQQILRPLNPLLIYLNSDVAVSLRRAIEKRSDQWLANIIPYMNSWSCHKERRIQTLDDVIDYFVRRNEHNLALLSAWCLDTQIIDTTANDWDGYKAELLVLLSLSKGSDPPSVPPERLRKYVGTYEQVADPSVENVLSVRMISDTLFVNAYWPNGSQLVPESDARFQLQDTNRFIDFDCLDTGETQGLVYSFGGKSYIYEKIS